MNLIQKIFGCKRDFFSKSPLLRQPRRQSGKKKVQFVEKGQLYDLREIYTVLNETYFQNKLDLKITWFGSAQRKARRHRKLGLYCFKDKLIKIHRLLDQAHFPHHFISYVVYHEMLHSVCPPIKVKSGGYRIHHDAFKKREREFADYAAIKHWEEKNKRLFFQGSYGGT